MNNFARLLLPLIVAAFGTLLWGARPPPTRDYIFAIDGVVTTEHGEPMQDVEVTLDVDGPVYKGVELIKTVKSTTDAKGGFSFMYMSHKRGVKYKLTVSKEGFQPQTLSGASPPVGHHAIHLGAGAAVASPP